MDYLNVGKHNKAMWPIVSFCGSPTCQLSKHSTSILKPLTDESQHKLQYTDNFIDVIKTTKLTDHHKLVFFDVKTPFTSIPLQLALDFTKTDINKSYCQPPLPTNNLIDLLHLSLTSTYFQYKGKHYKQLHGTAMGSPVSVVVTESHAKHRGRGPSNLQWNTPSLAMFCGRYVHKNKIHEFHEHLNKQNTSNQFTKEIE